MARFSESTRSTGVPANAIVLPWLAWLLGPVGFVFCSLANDGDPNCSILLVAVVGHGASVVITIIMLGALRRFRSLPEFWLMLAYWIPLAGMFVDMTRERPTEFGRVCWFAVLWWAVLTPGVGIARSIVALPGLARGGRLPSN
jgi:hypothetical protein